MNRKITLILPLFVLGFLLSARAQCPPNIDFELGTTADWLYYRGSCYAPGGAVPPLYVLSSCAAIPGLHTLTTAPGTDYYGGFPTVSPGGGLHSLKLGKDSNNCATMRCEYNVHVPTGTGLYSVIYRYAAVLENPPSGHTEWTEPRFVVKAFDSLGGPAVACDSYTYVGDGTQPGFLLSSVTSTLGNGLDVYYKTWTMGNMKFPGLNGHVITVQFTAQGCTQTGHFGYGYVDMSCGLFADQLITCASGSTTLTGPDGFSGYHWYDSLTFSTSYGTSQSVVVTSPTVATTYAVILTPYAGYGCTDTLYTRVVPTSISLNPSHDTTICAGNSLTLSAGAASIYTPITYLWGPSTGLSCVTCASPVATPTVSTNYYVTATDANGCTLADTIHVTVVAVPGTITGPLGVCLGQTVTLGDSPPGGTWTSSLPGTAAITPVTGVVTGMAVGTGAIITYTLGGSCKTTRGITVNPNPLAIGGTGTMCIGTSTTLTDATPGGTWSSTSGLISVGGTSGVVTGISAGTAVVTYTLSATGCYVTKTVTVNPSPSAISGTSTVCVGQTLVLVDISPGGTWSCAPTIYGTITPVTGILTGISAGAVVVTYTLSTGCTTTATINVLPIPGPISGPTNVCIGDSITLTDPTPGGTWVASNSNVAIPNPFVGLLIGEPSGGLDTISYTAGTSVCPSVYVVSVNPFTSPIGVGGSGVPQVCVGQTLLLNDADPGYWSSSNTTITTIGSSSGIVNGLTTGNDTITFTNSLGCRATIGVTVNGLPAPITGLSSLCVGTTITLADATIGGTFTTSGPHASVSPGGVVTGLTVGTQLITYTSTLGCFVTYSVTVNTTPPPIGGVLGVCQGLTTVLTDGIAGGIWTITPTTTATIVSTVSSATVTGVAPGTATVTYALGLGCSTSSLITVYPMPGPITPAVPAVCVLSSITLADPTSPGGTWSPVSGTFANINAITGLVSGVSAGLQVFTYTSTSGCIRQVTVNVNPLPLAIGGPTAVCVGQTIPLSDGSGGGTWTSLNLPIATVTATTGVVTGVAPGTATIKYQLTSGCATAAIITVNAIPPLFTVTGGGSLCTGGAGVPVGLSGSTVGVNYRISIGGTPTGPTVIGTGSAITFGAQAAAGTYTIVASYPATGCSRTMTGSVTVVVNPVPMITGPTALCVGATLGLSSSIPGSTWSSSAPGNATVGLSTGIVTGITSGSTAVITCTAPTLCTSNVTINVTPSPGLPAGPSNVCIGDSTLYTDLPAGGAWYINPATIASVGSLDGYVTGVSTGVATLTYSLGTGCQQTKSITVLAQPLGITGTMTICQGASTTLHDATPGGIWSVAPASSSLATVSTSGVVTAAITGGTAVTEAAILYTNPATGCRNWTYVTINPLPAPITGTLQVCVGSTTTLSDATPAGSWSVTPPPTIASITGGGTVSGLSNGSTVVTYTVAGCIATAPLTVNPLPGTISSLGHVCTGDSITLSSPSPGGTWSIGLPGSATVGSASGIVYGIATGSAVVTYTLPTSCYRTTSVAVNQTPSPISGPAGVCVTNSAAMSDPTPGGTWSSSNTTVATIGAGTGIVATGPTATGSLFISYTVGTCAAIAPFTVLPHPAVITGALHTCVGSTTNLYDATPGGNWTSGETTLATVSTTGVVTGIASGTVIMSYGALGCTSVAPVIVNPISQVLGDSVVCQGQSIILTDTTLGGGWSSASPAIASAATSGVITGVAPGTTTIIYTIGATSCTASRTLTVNSLPTAITGPDGVCVGQSIALFDLTPGGTWSSSNPAIGSIDASGNVMGIAAGVATMTYTLSATSCFTTFPVTVNPLPSPIVGPENICVNSIATYTNGSGSGTWLSSVPTTAFIGFTSGIATAGMSAGTTNISFTLLATGCVTSMPVNVINLPSNIYTTGPAVVCQGSTITLYDTSGSGTWTSGNPAIATVSPTGVVTGLLQGIDTITYATGAGCAVTMPVTVNRTPNAPSGITNLCVGASTTLSSFPTTGTWSSFNTAVATTGPGFGVVNGVSAGSSVISYVLPDGCFSTTTVFVDATPPNITGINTVCVGLTSALGDSAPGGLWASSSPAATVDATGLVTGVSPGFTTISYTIAGTTCPAILPMTVNPIPGPITGTMQVCVGLTTMLHDAVPGTGWSSLDTTIASVNTAGIVTGVAAGTTTISYTLGAACAVEAVVTVYPIPAAISGADSVCQGQFLLFTDATPLGSWSSSTPSVATIGVSSGIMSGVAAGSSTISYTVNGCSAYHSVTVDVQPGPITGNPIVCYDGTSALHDAIPGGTWTSSFPSVAPISSSGVVFGNAIGFAVITYTEMPGACVSLMTVNVVPLPQVFNMTGGGNYCRGGNGVLVGLNGSTVGVNYMLYRGATATGSFAGTGSALSFGLQTVPGTYTVIGTATATGCSQNMSGSEVIDTISTVTPSVTLNTVPGDTVCTGTSVSFSPVPVNGGAVPAYQWSVNGTNVATSATYTFIPANGDVVGVTMTSNAICPLPATATKSLVMTVQPFATPAVALSATPGDTVCQGSMVNIAAVPTYGGNAPVYTWYKNGVNVPAGSTYSYVPVNNDIIYCIIQSDYPCRLNTIDTSASMVLTVDEPVIPIVSIATSPNTIISKGQTVTMTATVANGGLAPTYQWFSNGIPVAGATSATFVDSNFTSQANDSISCQVTSSGFCPTTGHQWVYIEVANVGVGQLNAGAGDIVVIPNPNKGDFMIKGTLGAMTEDVNLEITDVLGQVVYKNKITASNGKLNEHIILPGQLANGMYILSVHTGEESKIFHMIIEQ